MPPSVTAKKRLLVVIPTYNERENIDAIITSVFDNLPGTEVLIVDDGSPDGTGVRVDEIAATNPRLHVLHRTRKQGLGRAYLAGFRWAITQNFSYIFEMDADFSHDPRMLPDLLLAAEQGADVVLGSRYIPGGGTENWGPVRKLISRSGNFYARSVLGVPTHDLTGGYKCFRADVLRQIDLDEIHSEGYAFQIETTYRALKSGFHVVEVPIRFVDRRVGQSKMSKAIVAEALSVVWRLRLSRL